MAVTRPFCAGSLHHGAPEASRREKSIDTLVRRGPAILCQRLFRRVRAPLFGEQGLRQHLHRQGRQAHDLPAGPVDGLQEEFRG
jgi:hypothetical protein